MYIVDNVALGEKEEEGDEWREGGREGGGKGGKEERREAGREGGKRKVKDQKREDREDERRGSMRLSHGKCTKCMCVSIRCVSLLTNIASGDCNGSIFT